MIRPLFSFFGAKWRLAPRYPAPAHRTIVEPFAGSAGYSLRYPDRRVILVERDPTIAALWRWLISVPSAEVLALPLLDVGEPVPTDLRPEARSLIGFWCCLATTAPRRRISSGGWGQTWPDRFWGARVRARVAASVERIRHWTIIEGDYSAAPNVRATWFVDPPYIGRRLRSKYGQKDVEERAVGDRYRFGTRRIDYEVLGRWCRLRRGLVIACDALGAEWLPFRPFVRARATSGWGEEVVWISSEHGVQLRLPEVA